MAQLEYLEAVTRNPTWAAAAVELGVTASALSQGLAELERRVGVRLFARAGRRRELTAEATVVVEHAQRVLAATRDLARWAEASRRGHTGALRVGMVDVAAVDHLPGALHAYRDTHPDVALHLTVAPSSGLLASLRRGALDLVVCVDPGVDADLVVDHLLDDPLAVYAPRQVPRATAPTEWGPWVCFPDGSRTREVIAEGLRRAGSTFEVVAESHQPEVLCEMVRVGMGWAVLPTIQAERGPDPLVRARTEPVATRRIVVVRRAGAITSSAGEALIEALFAAVAR